jgi:hypothetical protein
MKNNIKFDVGIVYGISFCYNKDIIRYGDNKIFIIRSINILFFKFSWSVFIKNNNNE